MCEDKGMKTKKSRFYVLAMFILFIKHVTFFLPPQDAETGGTTRRIVSEKDREYVLAKEVRLFPSSHFCSPLVFFSLLPCFFYPLYELVVDRFDLSIRVLPLFPSLHSFILPFFLLRFFSNVLLSFLSVLSFDCNALQTDSPKKPLIVPKINPWAPIRKGKGNASVRAERQYNQELLKQADTSTFLGGTTEHFFSFVFLPFYSAALHLSVYKLIGRLFRLLFLTVIFYNMVYI